MTVHQLFLEPFSYGFMQRGVCSAIALSVSGGLLGSLLILRRMALMGDALSHSVLPGVALAFVLFGPNTLALYLGALIAGLLTAAGSALLSRLTRIKEDAAFGSLFIIFFASGIALVSTMRARIDLMHFLFGNVLGVSPADLRISAVLTALTVAIFLIFRRAILLETFDPVFYRATGGRSTLVHLGLICLTVLSLVSGLQAMGVVLALGLFLLPAVTAYLWCDRLGAMFAVSIAVAILGSLAGILLSYHLGIASGASIVLSLGFMFVLSALASPRYGLASRLWRDGREGKGVLRSPQ